MFIPRFAAGVLATLLTELIIIIVFIVRCAIGGKRK